MWILSSLVNRFSVSPNHLDKYKIKSDAITSIMKTIYIQDKTAAVFFKLQQFRTPFLDTQCIKHTQHTFCNIKISKQFYISPQK